MFHLGNLFFLQLRLNLNRFLLLDLVNNNWFLLFGEKLIQVDIGVTLFEIGDSV